MHFLGIFPSVDVGFIEMREPEHNCVLEILDDALVGQIGYVLVHLKRHFLIEDVQLQVSMIGSIYRI